MQPPSAPCSCSMLHAVRACRDFLAYRIIRPHQEPGYSQCPWSARACTLSGFITGQVDDHTIISSNILTSLVCVRCCRARAACGRSGCSVPRTAAPSSPTATAPWPTGWACTAGSPSAPPGPSARRVASSLTVHELAGISSACHGVRVIDLEAHQLLHCVCGSQQHTS